MNVKGLFVFALLVIFGSSIWAAGRKDNISKYSEDPSGFTDTFDISERKPGRYNFYMEAKDRAGNSTFAGPGNIYIDPESDLPRTTIINPLPYMSVPGNLNIVGIAFDDDAVKQVEIAVYRGTDGKGEEIVRVTASGTDYWSYFLDTSDGDIWHDGDYTVKAWSTDINDLSGIADFYPSGAKVPERKKKISTIYWRLDRKKPETLVTSHTVGALVSGTIHMSGTVADGNGIAVFSYSLDGGEKYISSKFNVNKNRVTGSSAWDIKLDTKQFKDGPVVIWFKAVDGNGSVGAAAHLLFVNNHGPEVKIVYPEPNKSINGLFSIAGYARHPVGLKSVTWKAANQQGEIELIPGNHWWSADVDARGFKGNTIEVEVRAVDISGNVTVERNKYKFEPVLDLPEVTIISPIPGLLNVLDRDIGLIVKGTVSDDDGVASIFYSLNGAPGTEIPCNGAFQFYLPTPNEGMHTLDVWAKDSTGVIGNKKQVRGIMVSNTVIEPGISSVTYPDGKATKTDPFYTGMILKPVQRMTMLLSFKSPTPPATSTIAFGEQRAIPVRLAGTKDVFTAAVPVPTNLPEGLLEIKLTATDRNQREFEYSEFVYIPSSFDAGVINTLTFVRQTSLADGRILLKAGDTLLGINEKPIRNAVVQGTGSNLISSTVDQYGRIVLTATDDGEAGPLTLRVDVDGGSFTSSQFRILSDTTGPTVSVQNFNNYAWARNSVPVSFTVGSRNRISAVEYSIDMGENWLRLLTPAEIAALRPPINSNFTKPIDLTIANDGLVNILLKATSESGLVSVANCSVLKDTQAPDAKTIMPIADASVNGTIRMAFAVEEMGAIQSITYRRNATSAPREVYNDSQWTADYSPRFFQILMDSLQMPLDNNMRFAFTDKAGNSSEVSLWFFTIDQQMDIPTVQIILPQDNEVITNDFIVSGVMFDDDGVKQYQWRLDAKPWTTETAEYGFSIPIALSTLTDNEHTVTIIAEDLYGVKSAPVTRNFRVSLNEPTGTMTYPLFDTVLKEGVELRGTAFDRNGIKEVRASIDNGNTYNVIKGNFGTAAETIQWNYQFNTTILKDGPHVVFIRIYDRYNIQSTYAFMINVDNTQPEIILDTPGDGSITVGSIAVMGRVLDPNLKEASIELRSLDGVTIPANLRTRKLDLSSMIKETLDISAMADGQYNVAIIATDRAGNTTRLSRNVQMARQTFRNYIEILYPLENEETSGEFNLYGYAGGSSPAGIVTLKINGNDALTAEVDDSGYFVFNLNREFLNNGNNPVTITSNFGGPTLVSSRPYNITYRNGGPWVTIDSFKFAEFSYDRAYLYGRTGYVLSDEDAALLEDKTTDKETRARILSKTPDYTEISFDNGRSFIKTNRALAKGIDYRYRLEDSEMPEGFHYILIRSNMKNGEHVVTRMLVQIDKTHPVIRLISPETGSRYNQNMVYSASATDDNDLVSLSYHLRIGGKELYEIPGALKGLYFEGIIPPFIKQLAPSAPNILFAGGATYTDFGFGISLFDDNVKIQLQYGFMTQALYESLGGDPIPPSGQGGLRYGGNVGGLKLLANVYALPLGKVWGPDFDWLFLSVAAGANFSLFEIAQSGKPTFMNALLLQLEFPKVTIPKRKNLRTFSLFTEGQLWFVPTDADAEKLGISVVIPHIIMGLRMYVF